MPYSNLQEEFRQLIRESDSVFDWFTCDVLDGFWYVNWDDTQKFWMNDSFLNSLKFDTEQASDHFQIYTKITGSACKKQIKELIASAKANPSEIYKDTLEFKNRFSDPSGYNVEILALASKGLVFKFKLVKEAVPHKIEDLEKQILHLEKFESIYKETNHIARIGGWDVDLISQTISWTSVTYDIHEVDPDFVPDLNVGISFYKEGWSRDLIMKLFNEAIELGKPFDDEFKLVTAKGNEIWVRSFGKPEFVNGKCIRVFGAFQDINEQKKQQIELKAAKNRFESIYDNSPLGILLFDPSDTIVAINPASKRIFGMEKFTEEQISKLTFKELVNPEFLDAFQDYKKELTTSENTTKKLEIQCKHRSGKTIWCSMISSLMPANEHTGKLVVAQVQDITYKKELQRQATENANKFVKAFENSPNGMGVVSTKGDWIMVNKNLAHMVGYEKNELLQIHFWDITHPDDHNNDAHYIQSIFSNEIDYYTVEKRYIHKQGRIVNCHLYVSAIYDELGGVKSLIFQVVDMTQHVKAQNDLKSTLKDLQSLLDATTQIVIVETDLNHVIKKFNKGAERILGYKAEEVINKKSPSLFHIPEEVETRRQQLSEEKGIALNTNDVFTYDAHLEKSKYQEWTYRKKDGTQLPVQLVVTTIRNQDNQITGYLGVSTDISELKEMEESLVIAKERAEMASKSKSEFLANMSHEIRTPLNGVIGFTDLLMKTELNESQSNYMQTVFNSANSLLDLINDILDFSKIEAGKLELSEEKVDIITLCEQIIDMFKHQAHKNNLEILLNISPAVTRFVWIDSVRIKQILTNLIGNAIKFTKQGEIELKIDTKNRTGGSDTKIFTFSVRDTGIGIAPHNLDKIFFAFDQEDASTTRKFGGTGLGLTISNRLLELMGSNLKVESTQGIGSKFYFDVGLKSYTVIDKPVLPMHNINKVLIVDDNDNNRKILHEMLTSQNINTVLAPNAIEAIDILEKDQSFSLAIIDYHMPYMDGLELIEHIRNALKIDMAELPIILLHSSVDDEITAKKCKEYKVQFNKTKPIHMDELFSLINQINYPELSTATSPQITSEIGKVDLATYEFSILVAEDNPVNKHLTRTILKKLMPKVQLIEVDNGEEAVLAFKEQKIDLIFMDIQMPILSGFEASEQIRALEEDNNLSSTPIVALTARTIKGERERCLSYGMNDYVTKPVIMQTLNKVIIKELIFDRGEKISAS
ncbi:PAS domain S-box protein [Flavimarina sp. Hel_I_48]|uniref:PAS domain-containing hybrid sensor histidine kinase/response regulator n=1 Tax=Flavimarina sp. Hel_I_48 TaxID=1392488 RepID=UPI0006896410|nr:PAS domain S-box protein [Flavimarina sp. Hel_I_48]